MDLIDHLTTDHFSALGDVPVIVTPAANWRAPAAPVQAVVIGTDAGGALPRIDPDLFDVLVTTAPDAPSPWVSVPPTQFDRHIASLAAAVHTNPTAATILAQVLRINTNLPFDAVVHVESLAYSTLLGGAEFARWRSRTPRQASAAPPPDALIHTARASDHVTLTLADPGSRNAMTAAMRDALFTALANLLDDPTAPTMLLRGEGRCFSTGGDLSEFGSATDLAAAHAIRTVRSCAVLLNRLGNRAAVHLHGACIGSGIEVAAAAARRTAAPDAWFQLPELAMGLIPGAGGTASIARAIGRHRTAWMVLNGKRIDAARALDWGLIHAITDAP